MDFDDIFGDNGDFGQEDDGGYENSYVPKTEFKTIEELSVDLKRKATQFDLMLDSLKGRHAERFNHVLDNMNDRDFANAYISVIGYVSPKMRPKEIEKPPAKKRTLEIKHFTVKK